MNGINCSIALLLMLLVIAGNVYAQEPSFEVLCRTIPEYKKSVSGVEYQAGVDVNGKSVVPADLNALDASIPDIINIPINLDMAQRFARTMPTGVELKPDVGMIGVHKDGRVTYNGQDISKQAYSVCAKDTVIIQPTSDGNRQAAEKNLDLPIIPKLAKP